MLRWLKNHFIPHEDNDYRPGSLKSRSILFMGIIVLVIEIFFLFQALIIIPRVNLAGLILSNVLVDETNSNRVADAMPSLKVSPLLEVAARQKADDMAKNGYFAHTSPSGITSWYWFQKAGYKFAYAGENLAINFSDSKDIINAWMNSPLHRENILNSHFTEIGIGIARGTYQGQEAVFVAQLFGEPLSALAYQPPKTTPVPVVLTEASASLPSAQNLFVAVKGIEEVKNNLAAQDHKVTPQSNKIQTIVSMPKTMTNYLFFVIGAFVLASFLLNILIKIDVQHKDLILNGFLLIFVLVGFLVFNQYITLYRAGII